MALPARFRLLFREVCVVTLMMLVVPFSGAAEVVSGVTAIVNDEIITTYELNLEYTRAIKEKESREGALSGEAAQKLRSDVLNAMIDRKLVRDRIRELNIVISEEEVRQSIDEIRKQNNLSQQELVAALLTQGMTFDQYRNQMKEKLERLRLISQEVKSDISVTEQESTAYYQENPAEFSEEGSFRARSIFFSLPKNASAAETRLLMGKVMAVLNGLRKKRSFAELAEKFSDDPDARKDGGSLGVFRKGEMLPEIEEQVLAMNPGEVSEIITTPAGFHIILLEEKTPPRIKPYAAVKAQIEEILYNKKSAERFNRWTEDLRRGASIEIRP